LESIHFPFEILCETAMNKYFVRLLCEKVFFYDL